MGNPSSESWEIEFYLTESGRNPVREALKELPKQERVEIGQTLRLVQEEGPEIGRPYTEPVTREIGAVRVRIGRVRWRIFFFCRVGKRLVLVHMLAKKTEAIPRHDIELSERRRKEWLRRKGS